MEYVPYPVGVITPAFDPGLHDELLRTFPPIELFETLPRFDTKYSLSEKHNPQGYAAFISEHPAWRELHGFIKSDDFIYGVVDLLRDRGVDLGIARPKQPPAKGLRRFFRSSAKQPSLRSRFEFSVLKARGGAVAPHTDAAKKFITLVFTMTREGEWRSDWGGGTDILATKDPAKSFNFVNRIVPYDETVTLRTVEFKPNQAMLFVKTFNSLHGVKEMRGPSDTLRRTLTVNIERGD